MTTSTDRRAQAIRSCTYAIEVMLSGLRHEIDPDRVDRRLDAVIGRAVRAVVELRGIAGEV